MEVRKWECSLCRLCGTGGDQVQGRRLCGIGRGNHVLIDGGDGDQESKLGLLGMSEWVNFFGERKRRGKEQSMNRGTHLFWSLVSSFVSF